MNDKFINLNILIFNINNQLISHFINFFNNFFLINHLTVFFILNFNFFINNSFITDKIRSNKKR